MIIMQCTQLEHARARKFNTVPLVIRNAVKAFWGTDETLEAILRGHFTTGYTLTDAILFFKSKYEQEYKETANTQQKAGGTL